MTLRIRNWSKFQHFKDRRPPWIKLYREILDDVEWHELSGDDAKMLVMLWLLASENDGELPDTKALAFRLRTTQKQVDASVKNLSHWIDTGRYQSDITKSQEKTVSDVSVYQETETETETDNSTADKSADIPPGFDKFWDTWPTNDRKQAKGKCRMAWKKASAERDAALVLAHVESLKNGAWLRDGGQFIPSPLVYLNQRRWEGADVSIHGHVGGVLPGAI